MAHLMATSLQHRINVANQSGLADPCNGLARKPFLTIPDKHTLTIFPITIHPLDRNRHFQNTILRPVRSDEGFFSRHELKSVEPYQSTHVEHQNEVASINEREANTNY